MTQPAHDLGLGDTTEGPDTTTASGATSTGGSVGGTEVLVTPTDDVSSEYPTGATASTASTAPTGSTGSADGGMKGAAKDTAHEATDRGKDVAGTAVDQAKSVGAEARSQAMNLLDQLRGEATSQVSSQSSRAAKGLESFGDQLRQMSDSAQQDGLAADLVRRLEEQVRSASRWLDEREPGELLDDVRGVARRRPGAFLAGAALLGLLGGRLTRGLTADSKGSSDGSPYASSDRSTYGSGTAYSTGPAYGTGTTGGVGTTAGTYGAYDTTGTADTTSDDLYVEAVDVPLESGNGSTTGVSSTRSEGQR